MTARWNVQFFKFIGVVSIVTLTLMAAVAESSAQTSKNITDDYYVCLDALNRERTAWDTNDPKFAKDVAEAIRRGLTVDRCRQMMPTRNPPANTQSQNKPPSIIANHTDENLCMTALNRERSAWDQNPNYSEYVAEARRRGLTVDRCRQMMPTRDLTTNLPASTDSGSISGWFLILVASAIIFLGWMFVRGVTPSVPAQGQDSWLRADAQEWSLEETNIRILHA